jgi:dipeptidyl-peptidase-4
MTESRTPNRCLASAIIACTVATGSHAAELTIDRLFDAPALSGPTIVGLQISPDGSRVTYLRGKSEDKDQLDLWEYNIRDGQTRLLVDSRVLEPARRQLSNEELSRRERQRTAALSGILEYSFAPSGKALLFPLGGALYYYDLSKAAPDALIRIAGSQDSFVTDAKVSPKGRYVAYVRDQNVYTYDLERRQERALTRDGRGPIKNGMAEFVAQEEMNRATGYWWAPDDEHIAFARVDETPVKVTQRFEIAADNVATFAQRYPTAGGANVLVRLGVASVHSGGTTWLDLGPEQDIYLARVNWMPEGNTSGPPVRRYPKRKLSNHSFRNQQQLDRVERRIDVLAGRSGVRVVLCSRWASAPLPL